MGANMKSIFGIDNVVDCVAIIGKNGVAEGFDVFYDRNIKVKVGKKTLNKVVRCKKTVWTSEPTAYVYCNIHGFGCGTVYKKTVSSKKSKKTAKNGKITISAAEYAKILGKI